MYIYVLYVSCFAFSWWTDVGICREVFTARHKGGMMHHHHNCTGTIYHLPITRYNLILSNKKNAPQKPSKPYAWKNKGFSQIRKMHLRNPQNLMHGKQGILSDKKMQLRNPQNLMHGRIQNSYQEMFCPHPL